MGREGCPEGLEPLPVHLHRDFPFCSVSPLESLSSLPPMPLHGERTGVAYQRRGHHLGVRDGLGSVVRSGAAVFTTAAYVWKVSGRVSRGT